jgi:hypothetical protein
LFPYVPDIDLHKYWHAVRPLLVAPVLPPLDLYRHTVIWLVVALVSDELWDAAGRYIVSPLLAALVLCARIVIVDTALSPAEVLGAIIALLGWVALLARLRVRAAAILFLLVILVILEALAPFRFVAAPRPFTWLPFHGFLHGSVAVNIQSFLQKTFLYGSLVWLAMRAGYSCRVAVPTCGALVFGLRLLQVYSPTRSAEISDVVIVLMIGGVICLLEQETYRPAIEKADTSADAPYHS